MKEEKTYNIIIKGESFEMEKLQNNNEYFTIYAPDSLKYITKPMEEVLIEKSNLYKEIFHLDNVRKVIVNYFDNMESFREFIYELRGERESLPEYARGTYDKGMVNAYFPDNINPKTQWFQSAIHTPAHELFHIMYMENILKNNYDLRIVWYDEGMAQFLSGEKDSHNNEENFIKYLFDIKENVVGDFSNDNKLLLNNRLL